MPPAKPAASSLALLGGVLLILHALLGGDGLLLDALRVAGLVSLMAASAAFGTTLVKGDAMGVRAVVAVASGLLTLSVIEAFRPADAGWYDGFWGVVAAFLGGLGLLRARGRSGSRRPAGAHVR